MNETGSFENLFWVVQNSPGWLLRELGLENELYLYRRGPISRCARILPDALDKNIYNSGPALLSQIIGGEELTPIIFEDKRAVFHECVSLAFDYTAGEFFFSFFSSEEKTFYKMTPRGMRWNRFCLPLSDVKRLVSSSP